METLNAQPNWGISLNREPQINKVTFGDGYEQSRPKGLNHLLRQYSLSFSGVEQQIRQIDDFLKRQGGYKSFYWTPSGDTRGKFKCEKWQVVQNTGYWQLSAEFREVAN